MTTPDHHDSSPRSVRRAPRWWPLAVIGVLAALFLAAVALVERGDPVELREGVGIEQVGEKVVGLDLTVVDTFQDVGFFVDTDAGPVFAHYGDAPDRFGVGTEIAELEGEVAPVTDEFLDELRGQVRPEQLDRLAGHDVYVRADEIAVAAPPAQ